LFYAICIDYINFNIGWCGKEKNIKKSASKVSKKEESMKNKVEIKQPSSAKQEKLSRLVGSIFIGLGVLL
jgi:hypothetical protein